MSVDRDVSPVPAEKTDRRTVTGAFSVRVDRDVRIPAGEPGLTLSADVYRPVTDDPVPALITVQPYRKDFVAGSTYAAPAQWFAERGYASLVVDLLGTGASAGRRRPEFDAREGEDVVAAIDWAVSQAWCTGATGAWGLSYAANTTLRAASLQPPHLRAIVAVVHSLDAGRDSVHPDGARGDLHALANRGTSMLLQQLLPPLHDYGSPAAQRRWQDRLRHEQPMLLDYARHGADDPVWPQRRIDGSRIVVPTLCVGGWRDGFTHGLIDAYEQVRGPKRLVMGPWGHTLPQDSAFDPIDFMSLMLGWWDRWLRDDPQAYPDDPPVLLHLDGPDPQWRAYASWPPADRQLVLDRHGEALTAPVPAQAPREGGAGRLAARHDPDPSVGTLRGLPGLGLGESCGPRDQHDDDLRCLHATGPPLEADLIIAGRAELTVHIGPDDGGQHQTPARLVARLTDVDPAGRSTLIAIGVLRPGFGARPGETPGEHRIRLRPVHHRVPAGHRLRVTLGDADFPRLTPLATPQPLWVSGLRLMVPVASADAGVRVAAPAMSLPSPPRSTPVSWRITRDLVAGGATVEVIAEVPHTVSPDGHSYRLTSELRVHLPGGAPSGAVTTGSHSADVQLTSGERLVASASVRCTQDLAEAHGVVTIDGLTIFDEHWTAPLTREGISNITKL